MSQRTSAVDAALKQVAALRLSGFHGDDTAVRHLLKEYGEDQGLADKLWFDLPAGFQREDVADLLALWSWQTSDNGAAIMRSIESWVHDCADGVKVWVALHQDAYPFVAHASRIAHLGRVASAFPSLEPRCNEMIAQTREWQRIEDKAGSPSS